MFAAVSGIDFASDQLLSFGAQAFAVVGDPDEQPFPFSMGNFKTSASTLNEAEIIQRNGMMNNKPMMASKNVVSTLDHLIV